MKALCLLLLFVGSVSGQTYFSIALTNIDLMTYAARTNFDVPAGTVFKIESVQAYNDGTVEVQYPQSTNYMLMERCSPPNVWVYSTQVLGPAKIRFTAKGAEAQAIAVLVGSFQTVNVTPALQGYAVQPNGMTATVNLQTSPDLISWKTATNGVYPANNTAAFYRLNLEVK